MYMPNFVLGRTWERWLKTFFNFFLINGRHEFDLKPLPILIREIPLNKKVVGSECLLGTVLPLYKEAHAVSNTHNQTPYTSNLSFQVSSDDH